MTIFGLETLDLSSKNVVPSDFLHYFDEGTSPKAITRYRSPINFIFDSSECLDHFKHIFSIEIIWAPIWAPTYAVNLKTFLKLMKKPTIRFQVDSVWSGLTFCRTRGAPDMTGDPGCPGAPWVLTDL